MYLFSHNAHHLVKSQSFFSDHEFFGEVYSQLATDYDDVAERIVGTLGEDALNLQTLMSSVIAKLSQAPSVSQKNNRVFFEYQLQQEQVLCNLIKQIEPTVSPGTQQLITEICNKSESRQYKIKQRLK